MNSTREIRPVDMEMVIGYLKENLRLETKKESRYMGSLSGFENSVTVQLVLCGEVISEVCV